LERESLHGQSSGLSPCSPLFRHAAPVSRASFRSAVHSKRQLQKALKKKHFAIAFFRRGLHTAPCVVRRGSASTTPQLPQATVAVFVSAAAF